LYVFLWQNGVKTDLNTLVPASSSLHMFDPAGINFGGEIVGLAIEKTTAQLRAFLAVPCDEKNANEEGCADGTEATTAARGRAGESPRFALPSNVRNLSWQRLGHPYHIPAP
jgi:hypothetical protein